MNARERARATGHPSKDGNERYFDARWTEGDDERFAFDSDVPEDDEYLELPDTDLQQWRLERGLCPFCATELPPLWPNSTSVRCWGCRVIVPIPGRTAS